MNSLQEWEKRPNSAIEALPKSPLHPDPSSTVTRDIPPVFETLSISELAEALHPDIVAAEERGEERGYLRGYVEGAMFARAECLAEHATIEGRIDAAAKRFYLMEADEAHRKAVQR